MNSHARFPFLGLLLREIITRSGFRPFFEEKGLDKDLDHLAIESIERKSRLFDLLTQIEEMFFQQLAIDCGVEWAETFWFGWTRTKESYQYLVNSSDITTIPHDVATDLIEENYFIPMFVGFLKLVNEKHQSIDITAWFENPFQEWLNYADSKAELPKTNVLEKLNQYLEADQRTISRWLSGEPIGKIVWPYRNTIKSITTNVRTQSKLSGWLMLTCVVQSFTSETKLRIKERIKNAESRPWHFHSSIKFINNAAEHFGKASSNIRLIQLHNHIQEKLLTNPLDNEIHNLLKMLNCQLSEMQTQQRIQHQFRYEWLKAKYAAFNFDEENAAIHYKNAVSIAWWCGGQYLGEILNEALLYAVGIGDKNAANIYWDKTFILRLNNPPKRELDKFELRRIAIAFEVKFSPLQAKERVPPVREVLLREESFSLSEKDLLHPNRKSSFADGKTRRSALMNAVLEGTLHQVIELIDAGADPNLYIPESNEGPFIYALRRACNRKDTSIMDYMLTLDISEETANRPASSFRETPLKLAIEMGNPKAVERLIQLGADIEATCDYMPSALCFAINMFYHSLNPNDEIELIKYFSGQNRADGYDAKKGFILDINSSIAREDIFKKIYANEQNKKLFDEVKKYFFRDPGNLRDVIKVLVNAGADCNRRYRVEAYHLANWTPTLFAAQTGDLEVFKILVEHQATNKGDLSNVLTESSEFEKYDALWVAVMHKRNQIIEYLKNRLSKQP